MLRLLVVVLAVSNLVIGGVSGYLLRQVDQRYSTLVAHAIPSLNNLRKLMSETIIDMWATHPREFAGPESTHAAAIDEIARAHDQTLKLRSVMFSGGDFADEPRARQQIQGTAAAFDEAFDDVTRLYATGEMQEGFHVREARLVPAFERHLAAIAAASDAVETRSLVASRGYSASTQTLSAFVLSLASWPVLVLAVVLLVLALFVVMVMASFRDPDGEMP